MNVTGTQEIALVLKSSGDTVDETVIGGDYYDAATTSTIDGVLIISDFELSMTQEETQHHGIGNVEPKARTKGGRQYELDASLQGEDSKLFDNIYGADSDLEFRLQGDEQEHTLTQGDWTDLSISGAEDEAMETSFTLTFLDHAVSTVDAAADEVSGE